MGFRRINSPTYSAGTPLRQTARKRQRLTPSVVNSWVRNILFAARISRVAFEKRFGTVPVPRVASGRKRSTLCVRAGGSFPLSGFPGRAVAKANDPCDPGMASATAAKYPRQSCYSSSQGRCCMGLIGPPIRATAKCLPPGSLARSPHPTSPSLRRNEDARPVEYNGHMQVPRFDRWVTQ
jgi:hypothetical protein